MSKKLVTFCSLIGLLIMSLACANFDNKRPKDPNATEDPAKLTEQAKPIILKWYAGQGTYHDVSVLGDLTTACDVPFEVTATYDTQAYVVIEGSGACVSDYTSCSLSEDERCGITAKGYTTKDKLILTSCNGDLEVLHNGLTMDVDSISGSFTCSPGSGDTIGMTLSLSEVRK